MCLLIFVASDTPLPIVEDDPDLPLFSTRLVDEETQPITRWFSKPHIMELTYGGCGCGFYYSESDLDPLSQGDVPDDVKANAKRVYEESVAMVNRLAAYIADASKSSFAEVYCCWDGDWEVEPESRQAVGLDYFGGPSFHFEEGQLLTVSP